MTRTKDSIEERLTMVQVALTNALSDPQLQSALLTYGYTAERLGEGQALRERAHALHQQQRVAYGHLTTAQESLRTAQARARTDYMYYVKVARLALMSDRGALKQLHLDGERKQARSGWLEQARQFYTVALGDDAILSRLGAHDVTEAKLEAGRQQVEAVDACFAAQHKHKGAARTTIKQRDEALKALEAWMREFRQSARWALKSRPKDLEKLGIAARS